MRYFLHPIQIPRMVQGINRGRETPVEAKDAIGHHSSHGEIVEGVGEVFPYVGVTIFSEAFIIESVAGGEMRGR